MKQYVIDELRLEDYKKLKDYLDCNLSQASISGVYRLPLPGELLTKKQLLHTNCKPHFFTIDLEETKMSCELLVRATGNIRCDCISYADKAQLTWFIDYTEKILDETGISI
jgi:hypothetical protein